MLERIGCKGLRVVGRATEKRWLRMFLFQRIVYFVLIKRDCQNDAYAVERVFGKLIKLASFVVVVS